jgi:CBS domain-containing protein
MTRKVRDIMSAAPVCMAPTESVSAAARAMKLRGVGTVLVVSGGRLEALVTDRDITIRVLAENRDPATTRLGDICTGELTVLRPDDDVQHAARLVRDRALRRLPVIADGVPVGMVSIGDLALDQDERSALSEISATGPDR